MEAVCDAALDTLMVAQLVPSKLSNDFRTDVMGQGCLHDFAPRLKAAVEQPFKWRGQQCARIADWSSQACAVAWAAASKKERNCWRIMITDMRKVYYLIRAFECGVFAADDARSSAVRAVMSAQGAASFSVVRKAAMQYGQPGKDYFTACLEMCDRV